MDDNGVKQARPTTKDCVASLSFQSLVATMAALVIGTAIAVLVASWSINGMKNMLVDQARDVAVGAAQVIVDDIATQLAATPGNTLADVLAREDVRNSLNKLVDMGEISMISIRDPDGNLAYSCFCPDSLNEKSCEKAVDHILAEDSSDDLNAPIIPVSQPIIRNGELVGHAIVGYSRILADQRIANLSNGISISLAVLSGTVLMVLLATVAMIYRMSCRNMNLVKKSTDQEHLANLGVLATGLAHEIRNPLSAMRLHLDVVNEDLELEDPDKHRESMDTLAAVQRQIDRLSVIVGNFVNLSLPTKMAPKPMKLEELIREVVMFLSPEFEKHQITIDLEMAEDMRIDGDPQALYQVLMNILINARQALEKTESKRIKIRGYLCKRGKPGWAVVVEDSGPGIPPGEEEAIFRQFVAKRSGGTGFGLSLAHHIVTGLGGTIIAERSTELGGARIAIKFHNAVA